MATGTELPCIEPSGTLAALIRLGTRRLADVPLTDAQIVRRRIVHKEPTVPKIDVAAFGSFI